MSVKPSPATVREGLEVVEKLRTLVPGNATMAQFAIRWILMNDEVTVVIPGARSIAQSRANAAASDLPPLSADTMTGKGNLRRGREAVCPSPLVNEIPR